MKNNYLPIIGDYPDMPLKLQSKFDKFFEDKKHDAMLGDDYSAYAAYVIDIVCYRRDANVSSKEMDILIDLYKYPNEYADRLTQELSELLGHNNTD